MGREDKRRKQKKRYIRLLLMIFLFIVPVAVTVCTDVMQVQATGLAEDSGKTERDNEKYVKVLKRNSDLFVTNDIVTMSVRKIGWGVIKGLSSAASQCAKLFDTAFDFLDFTTWSSVNTYVAKFKNVWKGLVVVSIFFIGVLLALDYEKKPKLPINICLAVLIITSSTFLLGKVNALFNDDLRASVIGTDKTTDVVYELVGNNIYDLAYIEKKVGLMKVKKDNRLTLDDITETDVQLININELIKPDDVSDSDSKALLGKRIVYAKGELTVMDISGALGIDWLSSYYYRYKVDWSGAILGLLALVIVYICLAYKVVRILYEIVIHRIMAVLYSANLSNSQKTLKILDSIKDSYIVLFLIMVCMKCFLLANKFITNNISSGFVADVLKLFIALAVIDGPNIVQQVAGIDAGLSSGVQKIMAATNMMRMFGGAVQQHEYMKQARDQANAMQNMSQQMQSMANYIAENQGGNGPSVPVEPEGGNPAGTMGNTGTSGKDGTRAEGSSADIYSGGTPEDHGNIYSSGRSDHGDIYNGNSDNDGDIYSSRDTQSSGDVYGEGGSQGSGDTTDKEGTDAAAKDPQGAFSDSAAQEQGVPGDIGGSTGENGIPEPAGEGMGLDVSPGIDDGPVLAGISHEDDLNGMGDLPGKDANPEIPELEKGNLYNGNIGENRTGKEGQVLYNGQFYDKEFAQVLNKPTRSTLNEEGKSERGTRGIGGRQTGNDSDSEVRERRNQLNLSKDNLREN